MTSAELSMNQIIHAAVRRDLTRTEEALRVMRDGDTERALQLRRAWAHLVAMLTDHHTKEDTLVWPFLQTKGVQQELLDAMESEHHALGEALRAGAQALDTVVAEPTTATASAAADVVGESRQVISGHLDHEEHDVEPIIRGYHEDPGWKEVEKGFRAGGPRHAGTMMAWLQDGGSPQAQASLRATIPPPVLFLLSRVFGRGYQRDVAPVWR